MNFLQEQTFSDAVHPSITYICFRILARRAIFKISKNLEWAQMKICWKEMAVDSISLWRSDGRGILEQPKLKSAQRSIEILNFFFQVQE